MSSFASSLKMFNANLKRLFYFLPQTCKGPGMCSFIYGLFDLDLNETCKAFPLQKVSQFRFHHRYSIFSAARSQWSKKKYFLNSAADLLVHATCTR
mmetsp:Transcript_5716/g.13003  ORF Transcript_5716/g.13003 Transcript_5716/m.13003 type:complete len:96 (+) Transcript_5716:190-477(+)